MTRKLTAKQEAYKNNRIAGMGVSESYRAAYDVKKMSDKSVSVAANKLEQDDRIAIEIQAKTIEIQEKALERAIVTIEDVVKGLLLEATSNGEGCTQSARVAAWKALTDFTGGFDSNRQKVDLNTEVTFNMSFGGDDE